MRKFVISILALAITFSAEAQAPPTPEQFLGYPLGSHYTPHYKVVGYFEALAKAVPSMIKLDYYGYTNEGRPLMIAIVASPENEQKLDAIRLNNLRLAGLSKDKAAPEENSPAIVWLSYNVHGNEASSTEAAMRTLYTLVDPTNANSKAWLQKVVVVIDPCINPDGRDRYVNWFNSVVGKNYNVDAQAREHREPWPGGRTNHYNFDLNRDWAWQTQVESQQRLKKYNEWLPQVHVDFHEQGYNSPYYFAPAAEPYHESITPWQREFQTMIGKNNAAHFDTQGWLYFTKEIFDLFYPSYGDTYPTYSGAIGMTFEQGGIASGLGVLNADGDTLTLVNRIDHHFTTSLSTIETSAQQSGKLVKEFHKFYADALTNGAGPYKSYVIKSKEAHADQLATLVQYLDRNGISFGFAKQSTPARGFNYFTGKEENFTAEGNDLVIPASQPRAVLLRVLMEPRSKLSDSATYDITAWSLPYVMGLESFAVSDKSIAFSTTTTTPVSTAVPDAKAASAYAWALPWKGMSSAKCLSQLLQAGIKMRYAETGFSANGHNFDAGTLIITRASNKQWGDGLFAKIQETISKAGITTLIPEPLYTGFVDKGFDLGSSKVRGIVKPKVALLTGEAVSSSAAGEIWHYFDQLLGYPVSLVNLNDLGRLNLKNYDVIIMPDGGYRFLSDRSQVDLLKNWIQQGGRLIAMESAVAQLAGANLGPRLKKEDDDDKSKKDSTKDEDDDKDQKSKDIYSALRKYENRDRDQLVNTIPGAIFRVELDNTHPLAFGYPKYYFTLKQDPVIYDYLKSQGWNVGVLKKDNYVSGFTGTKTMQKLKDGLLIGVQDMGNGELVFFADDPIFRSFWENGKLMLANAIFLVGQ